MITAKCWVCRDKEHGVLYCNKCADNMERKSKAWDALVGFSDSELRADAQSLELEFVRLRNQLENDDGK